MSKTSMLTRRQRFWVLLVLSIGFGVLAPWVELRWKCRTGLSATESCVWARSYWPLSRIVEPIILAPIVFAVLYGIATAWERFTGRPRTN